MSVENKWHPINLTPTIVEQELGITATNPFGDLSTTGKVTPALNGWTALQTAVGETLVERLNQAQSHRSRAWAAIARG